MYFIRSMSIQKWPLNSNVSKRGKYMKEEYLPRFYKYKGPWAIYVKVIFKSVAPMWPGDPSDQPHTGGYSLRYNPGLYGHQMGKCAEIKLGKWNILSASKCSPWKEHALNWVEPNENVLAKCWAEAVPTQKWMQSKMKGWGASLLWEGIIGI